MKFLLINCLFICNSALAAFPFIDVQNIYGDYLDGTGAAYASKAIYKVPKAQISHQNIEVNFDKKEKNLVISDPSTTVVLEFDFSFLNVFKAFSFQQVDIKSDEKKFAIDAGNVDLYIDPKKYHMEDIYTEIDVQNLPIPDEEDITIVDGLILNALLKINKLSFEKFDDVIFDDIRVENPLRLSEVNKWQQVDKAISIPMIVRKISFLSNKGSFTGKALIDSYINLWMRVRGTMESNKDNTELKIVLKAAHLGYFNIRNTILNMIFYLRTELLNQGRIICVALYL